MFKFINLLEICFLFFINFSTFGKTLVINGNNYEYSKGYWKKNNVRINGMELIKLIKEMLAEHGLKGINEIMNIQNNKTGTNAIKELIMNYSDYCARLYRGASCEYCTPDDLAIPIYYFNNYFLDFFDYDYGYVNDKKCNEFHCGFACNYSLDNFLDLFFNSDKLQSTTYVGEAESDGLYFFVVTKFKEPIAHRFTRSEEKKEDYYNLVLPFHVYDTISLDKIYPSNGLDEWMPIPYKEFNEGAGMDMDYMHAKMYKLKRNKQKKK